MGKKFLQGIPVCSGVVTGKVKVITNLGQNQADPGWRHHGGTQ
jgi:hypothetical protein